MFITLLLFGPFDDVITELDCINVSIYLFLHLSVTDHFCLHLNKAILNTLVSIKPHGNERIA